MGKRMEARPFQSLAGSSSFRDKPREWVLDGHCTRLRAGDIFEILRKDECMATAEESNQPLVERWGGGLTSTPVWP